MVVRCLLFKIKSNFLLFISVMVTEVFTLKIYQDVFVYFGLYVLFANKKFITRKSQFHVGTQLKTTWAFLWPWDQTQIPASELLSWL